MLVRLAACALVLGSLFWAAGYLLLPDGLRPALAELEGGLLLFGGLSSVAVAMALALWAARRVSGRFAKRGPGRALGLARRWARFLRAHHTAFGWAALAAAAAHSLYFASVSLDYSAHALAGWAALAVLAALVVAGTLLDRARGKRGGQRRRGLRVLHVTLAALFVLALSFHAAILAVVLVVWGLLAVPAVLVWRTKEGHNSARHGRRHLVGQADGERR
jgi:hypothetical protein